MLNVDMLCRQTECHGATKDLAGNTKGGSITVPLTTSCLFGISYMTTDNFCFYLQNRLIQTSQTGGQWYSDTSPFGIPRIWSMQLFVAAMISRSVCHYHYRARLGAYPQIVVFDQQMSQSKSKCWYSNNGIANFKKYKQLFEYHHLLWLRDIWWSRF